MTYGYTVLGITSVLVTVIIDRISGLRLTGRKQFYLFQGIVIVLTVVVDNFISGSAVRYDPDAVIGVFIGSVPVENILFGFSLMTLNLILFERYSAKLP